MAAASICRPTQPTCGSDGSLFSGTDLPTFAQASIALAVAYNQVRHSVAPGTCRRGGYRMYAAIRRHQINPEHGDEVVREIAEDLAPVIKAVEGLIEYYILDAGDGVFVTIT